MAFRGNLLPRSLIDLLPFAFLITIIPITYWFEIWVALPGLYSFQTDTSTYCILFTIGHFLLLNIVGNLLGVVMTDTSIRGRTMPSVGSPSAEGYCQSCATATPPRSYHCPTCNICILRRDHHCLFTACCIGHYNYRYFLMFLFHMFFATAFCLPYNVMFLWEFCTWANSIAVAKVLFPFLMFLYGPNFSGEQGYLLVCAVSFGGMLFIGLWFYFHLRLAMSGRLVHELRYNISLYDRGLTENMKEVLGERWYLVWISPFIKSPPTSDGIHFKAKHHAS